MGHNMPFQLRLTLKLHINTRFGLPLEQETYDDVLQWETSIAAEVFHNLS